MRERQRERVRERDRETARQRRERYPECSLSHTLQPLARAYHQSINQSINIEKAQGTYLVRVDDLDQNPRRGGQTKEHAQKWRTAGPDLIPQKLVTTSS